MEIFPSLSGKFKIQICFPLICTFALSDWILFYSCSHTKEPIQWPHGRNRWSKKRTFSLHPTMVILSLSWVSGPPHEIELSHPYWDLYKTFSSVNFYNKRKEFFWGEKYFFMEGHVLNRLLLDAFSKGRCFPRPNCKFATKCSYLLCSMTHALTYILN